VEELGMFPLISREQQHLTSDRYNIEAMNQFLPVESFSHVYLVDLSPSLLEVARQRFERLGWKNVTVVCQDAREFRLPGVSKGAVETKSQGGADLVTMSYSLSMIPGTRSSYSDDVSLY
jgi:betaine lipid synthase